MNRPIFIIGSPRSGTSILTWCLGQHSNILVQEESDWLGRFALDVEVAYRTGTHRGPRSQLSASGIRRETFFASFGQTINDLVLSHRTELLRTAEERAAASRDPPEDVPEFKYERSASDPKRRWVDGTPEYSFYVCGLRKLFPEALFIHVLRDAAAVVRSMLHFERSGGRALAGNEEQAYAYWLRRVNACALAERAYGSRVVRRVLHIDLVAQPEATMRALLEFVDEPYEAACLEPLRLRINSSKVPADLQTPPPATNQSVIEEAVALENKLFNEEAPIAPSPAAASELEAEFEKQVRYVQNVGNYHAQALSRIADLEKKMKDVVQTSGVIKEPQRKWFSSRSRRT